MTDKEFLEGEACCPVFGEGCRPEFCAGCKIGNDGTAACPFRKVPYVGETEDDDEA